MFRPGNEGDFEAVSREELLLPGIQIKGGR